MSIIARGTPFPIQAARATTWYLGLTVGSQHTSHSLTRALLDGGTSDRPVIHQRGHRSLTNTDIE